jgi:flagellar biosynthetic protein FlhB
MELSVPGVQRIIGYALLEPLIAVGPLLALLVLAAMAAQWLQNGFLYSGESLIPKFSKISPATCARACWRRCSSVRRSAATASPGS